MALSTGRGLTNPCVGSWPLGALPICGGLRFPPTVVGGRPTRASAVGRAGRCAAAGRALHPTRPLSRDPDLLVTPPGHAGSSPPPSRCRRGAVVCLFVFFFGGAGGRGYAVSCTSPLGRIGALPGRGTCGSRVVHAAHGPWAVRCGSCRTCGKPRRGLPCPPAVGHLAGWVGVFDLLCCR